MSRQQRDILVLDAGSDSMQAAIREIRQLGYRAVAAKTPEQAHALLRFPGSTIATVVVPSDFAVVDMKRTLGFMRAQAHTRFTFVVAGARPDVEMRREFRSAGVEIAVWEPLDPHTLRFQLNRALADAETVRRVRANPRAPAFVSVSLQTGGRTKQAKLYSVSEVGAFLATKTPLQRASLLELELELPAGSVQSNAQVAMTNVPGNLLRQNLPIGMGVAFLSPPFETQTALRLYTEEKLRSLHV